MFAACLLTAVACGDGGGDRRTGAQRRLADRLAKSSEAAAQKLRDQVERDSLAAARKREQGEERPFVLMKGYFVRGTDEQSFKDCATGKVHFLRADAERSYLLQQHYRWNALSTLAPVYLEIYGRVIEDTVRLNENFYESVIEVKSLVEEPGPRACKGPLRGSLVAKR